jgi:DNA-binding NarL/FixJ family response regulator
VSVVIADAHPVFRHGLELAVRSWPEFELLHSAADASVLDLLKRDPPSVLLADPTSIRVNDRDLLQAAGERTRLVLITSDPKPAEIYSGLAAGVAGYLRKDCSPREVCDTLSAASRGDPRIGASVQPLLAKELRLRRAGTRPFLTQRETEVLKLMARNLSAPQIAEVLEIGTATVKTHQGHIYERLGVHGAKAALVQAMRTGLLE